MEDLKVGDKVVVMDRGLLRLQQFAPKGARPNNVGWVNRFNDDGTIEIKFPIGDDDPEEHSQVAPYSPREVIKKDW